jgi:quinoprotein glucose dehydrogenase
MKLFALDAATGEQQWIFDPNDPENGAPKQGIGNVRGVSYWTDGKKDQRLFYTAGALTFAINAENGKPIPTFGTSGYLDLHNDLDRESGHLLVTATSPGMIYKDLLIMGTRLDEAPPAAPGHIRAYDVRTGKRKWIFHTIPHPGEYGYDTWEDKESWKYAGGANVWSGFSLDQKRGILFAPTGSAVYDFYGGKRKGANLFANCLLALDAATGKRLWHFQFMHHDVWDKDLPTPPALVTLKRNGKVIDAVAQPTKNGMVYVFERETGKPIFDIVEMAVDTVSELVGEQLWPTQPVPLRPPAFVRQKLTANDVNPYLPDSSKNAVRRKMAGFRWGVCLIRPVLNLFSFFQGLMVAQNGADPHSIRRPGCYMSTQMKWPGSCRCAKTPFSRPQKKPGSKLANACMPGTANPAMVPT